MTRTATHKGQKNPRVERQGDHWIVYDDNGFVFCACPYQRAVAPLFTHFTVTPAAVTWPSLTLAQQEHINLVEMCLSKAPIDPMIVSGPLFFVAPPSPWYVAPTMPERQPRVIVSRTRARESEETVVTPLTRRRFTRDGGD